MNDPGLVVTTGVLVQRSALSVGGSDETGLIDDAFCLDGRGRPTLRGTSLTGALLDSIRKCGYDSLPPVVTGDTVKKRNDKFYGESVLRVWTTHPQDFWHIHDREHEPRLLPRAGIGIRQDTGAAMGGALYDAEVLPVETRWPLIVELDLWRYRQLCQYKAVQWSGWSEDELLATLFAGLGEWQRGHCWIGRGVARGMGWMRLESLQTHRIPAKDSLQWASQSLYENDIRRTYDEVCKQLANRGIPVQPDPNLRPKAKEPWNYLKLAGTIRAGERKDGWGLDSLSIGGHQAGWSEFDGKRLLKPAELKNGVHFPDKPSDMMLAMTPTPGSTNAWEPFIPGSGIRGALRHALSRSRRSQGKPECDPLTKSTYGQFGQADSALPEYRLDQLFGQLPAKGENPFTDSSRLLVRDAGLSKAGRANLNEADRKGWCYAVLQMHAENEFTASVFADSKFDRMAVLNGEFEFEIVVEAPPGELAQASAAIEEIRSQLLENEGHGLAIGGGQWRAHGWVEWACDPVEKAVAGKSEEQSA